MNIKPGDLYTIDIDKHENFRYEKCAMIFVVGFTGSGISYLNSKNERVVLKTIDGDGFIDWAFENARKLNE